MQKGRQEEHQATFFVIYRIKRIYHCAGTKATIVVHRSQKPILSHQQFVQHKCRKAGCACVMNVESNKLMASSSSSSWLIFLPLSFNKPQSSPSFEASVLLYFPCSSKVLFVSCFRTLLGYLAKAAVRADLTLRLVSFWGLDAVGLCPSGSTTLCVEVVGSSFLSLMGVSGTTVVGWPETCLKGSWKVSYKRFTCN